MSNTSPKKQDGNSKDTDSAEDDEEDLQDALKEMVKIPDIDERPGTSRRHFEVQDSPEKGELKKKSTRRIIQKDQAEQGSQTCENRKKVKKSSTDKKELDSDDSWAALFIKRFSWTRNPTEAVSTRSNAVNPTTKISLAEVTENNLKTGATTKSKSSTETSNESLIRTDHYGYSKSKTGETNQNQLSDEESGDESAEFLDKLKKIEEASKPKSWKRPTPIVIKANPISSTTKKTEDEVQAKPRSDNEDKHRYINILKVPFHRNLNYAAENETNNQTTNNQPPEDVDTRTSPEKVSLGSPPPNSALKFAQKNENIDGKSGENPREISAENAEQKKRVNTDSQRTLTITGHSHITTKWQDHCHFRDSQQTGSDKVAKRKLITACFLCTIFMIIEIVGGVISNSLAIATDAAHLLTDLASFLISLFALYLAGRPSSERLNFGWYRAEVIGAMISVFFIWVVTGEWHPCVYGHYAVGTPRFRSGGQDNADHLGIGHTI
ncbi:uncharacterized protein DDB_G0286299 isoform X2 [Drosophila rhopaloa]|uniref:Uncharacterized protein DDB_G0286299 isoform X2 n=1 Tax=Drosophila rhopaloa TaxID=1041015 RepID=A0A6P4F6D2_DRORH|nr:uncharacterized protein DDB_G0286299 isoform X2 [Drosophila rhopaloa]